MFPFKRRRAPAAESTRRAAWQEVAARAGGRFVPGRPEARDRVIVPHEDWQIHLDTFVESNGQVAVTYTRARAHFLGWRELKLLVRRRNVFDRLVETLGFGSRAPVGRALTERYVVKGRPRARVPSLFSGSHLATAIMAVPSLRLEIKRGNRKTRRRFGDGCGSAVCRTTGVITDSARLLGMIEVVKESLSGLARIGEAGRQPLPGRE